MKYFFVPGRNYDLSKAELQSVISSNIKSNFNFEFKPRYILLTSSEGPEVIARLFNRLGGFISCGLVYDDIDLVIDEQKDKNKVTFGISVHTDTPRKYPKAKIKEVLDQIKDAFKSRDISSRYIIPKALLLETAQIIHNDVLEKGFELVIFDFDSRIFYGKTLAVQDINQFSMLEYDKPYTDKEMGVLPAKLATIMVNLLGLPVGSTVWDPFCGSGTIPLVSLINGYNVLGSDISADAVEGTKKNIEWLASSNKLNNVGFNIFVYDVLNPDNRVVRDLRKTSIQGIACEPFMGPPQFKPLAPYKAEKLLANVEALYSNLFEVLEKIRLTEFKAVIVVPSYKTFNGWMTVSLNKILSKKWRIDSNLIEKDLHWKRSDSIIKRNIFVVSKKN
ncbi:MAG TPA: hypothetical protein PLV59_02700 [Candidatus Dojkabacteria bacterium]|nr:hypothetical protein [Candidatus Dojkabacteria bacterium]